MTDAANALFAGVLENVGGALSLTKSGAGVLILTGANTYTGTTTISAGTLQIGNGGATGKLGSVSGAVVDNGVLDFDVAGAVSIARAIGGSGAVTQSAGTLSLLSDNTYTGGTTVAKGTLIAAATGAVGSGAITVAAGGTLELDGKAETVSGLSGAGTIEDGAAAAATLSVSLAAAATSEFDGVLEDGGAGELSLTLNGGTQVLTGNNTYSGGTTVSAGTLQAGSTTAFGSGAMTVEAGATLDLEGNNITVAALSGAGTIDDTGGAATLTDTDPVGTVFSGTLQNSSGPLSFTLAGAGVVYFTGANTYDGSTTLDAGTLVLGGGGPGGSIASASDVVINSGGDLDFFRSDNFTFANAISGDGLLRKFLADTVTLSDDNVNFSGQIYDGGGALVAGAIDAFGTGGINVGTGAILDLGGFNQSMANLIGSGTIDNSAANAATFTETNAATSEFDGTFEDAGGALSLVKAGAGALILTGNETYSGATTVAAGALQIGNGGATGSLGSGGVDVQSGSALIYDVDSPTGNRIDYGISGAGGVIFEGGGDDQLYSNDASFSGSITIASGTVLGVADDPFGSGSVVDNGGLYFHFASAASLSNVISGAGYVVTQEFLRHNAFGDEYLSWRHDPQTRNPRHRRRRQRGLGRDHLRRRRHIGAQRRRFRLG